MIKKIAKVNVGIALLAGAATMQSCDKDILTGQPSWLGNSIYERLQEGIEVDGQTKSFNTTLRLIDDLGYKETLSMTGSKTVFVASDEDYNAWFANNSWGVRSYDQLTIEQKKQLFNGSMINNAYLIELMSNTPATSATTSPEKGMCMRREASSTIYDNVPQMTVDQFPKNEELESDPVNTAWKVVRDNGRTINIMKDATSAPMIHFLPDFMQKNNITDEDLRVVSNGASDNIGDSWINGKKVVSSEQTCKNGYIYVVNGVMSSNPNMAEIINDSTKDVSTTQWASLLRRYSVPVRLSNAQQADFWRLFPQYDGVDSLYTLRYLNSSSNHGLATVTGNTADNMNITLLKFDPGWNQYKADELLMQNDCAAMLVPTDKALDTWFNEGPGKTLKKRFGSWDNIDLETLVKLINVNMLGSFVSTVPSKFNSILDDSQRVLGITKDNIVKCYMGCNGVVYVVDEVFAPAEYSSVTYPALVEGSGSFGVIYKALQGRAEGGVTSDYDKDFTPYLAAMDSRFSLIIPYNVQNSYTSTVTNKVIRYIDPCSWGLSTPYLMEFYIGSTGAVIGNAYPINSIAEDGTIEYRVMGKKSVEPAIAANRLFDYIDNSTLVEDIRDGVEYYKTKAGSVMHAFKHNGKQAFQGGYQMETGEIIEVGTDNIFPMDNGTTYGVCADVDPDVARVMIPLTAPKSVYELLKEQAGKEGGDHLFYDMIFMQPAACTKPAALYSSKSSSYLCTNPTENRNMTVFDNYNYTVYVPTDAEIKKLIDQHYLPTWDDYDNAETEEQRTEIANRIHNFVRYHIQDNSVFVGGEAISNGLYESAKLNDKTKRFYTYKINASGKSMTLTDASGREHKVLTNGNYYNKACREMWINANSNKATALTINNVCNSTIEASSYIVVHQIDSPLIYDNSQLTDWRYAAGAKRFK